MQKATFHRIKDGLSRSERPSFANHGKTPVAAFYVKYHKNSGKAACITGESINFVWVKRGADTA